MIVKALKFYHNRKASGWHLLFAFMLDLEPHFKRSKLSSIIYLF